MTGVQTCALPIYSPFFLKFVVKNLRIVQGDKGVFIGMPSNKRKNGEFIDLFFPITQDARDLITNAILAKYQEVAREQSQAGQAL